MKNNHGDDDNLDGRTNSRVSKDDRMILALLQNPSVPKAAEALGVHPSTVWRRLQNPEFDRRLRQARRAQYSQAMSRLQQLNGAAITTLGHIMLESRSDHARVRASTDILKLSQANQDREDLLARVARVENE